MKAVFTTQLENYASSSVDKHDMRVFEARSNLAALQVELQNH
jgi:hypothetical protein